MDRELVKSLWSLACMRQHAHINTLPNVAWGAPHYHWLSEVIKTGHYKWLG